MATLRRGAGCVTLTEITGHAQTPALQLPHLPEGGLSFTNVLSAGTLIHLLYNFLFCLFISSPFFFRPMLS